MVKIKIRINTSEGKPLTELDAEFDKDEGRHYAQEEVDLLGSIVELISTVNSIFEEPSFVFDTSSIGDELKVKTRS